MTTGDGGEGRDVGWRHVAEIAGCEVSDARNVHLRDEHYPAGWLLLLLLRRERSVSGRPDEIPRRLASDSDVGRLSGNGGVLLLMVLLRRVLLVLLRRVLLELLRRVLLLLLRRVLLVLLLQRRVLLLLLRRRVLLLLLLLLPLFHAVRSQQLRWRRGRHRWWRWRLLLLLRRLRLRRSSDADALRRWMPIVASAAVLVPPVAASAVAATAVAACSAKQRWPSSSSSS